MSKQSVDLHENESTSSTKSGVNPTVEVLGKVLVKAQFNDDIRRVPIHNEDITYDELVLMMQRVFRGQLKPDDDIIIKYQDEDGDMVTIFDSADLSFAITYCRVLKLKIIVKDKDTDEVVSRLKNIGVQEIRKELKELRDRANKLLDVLDAEIENRTIIDKPTAPVAENEKVVEKPKMDTNTFTGVSVGDQNIFSNAQQQAPGRALPQPAQPVADSSVPPQSLTPQPSYMHLPGTAPPQSAMPQAVQSGNLNLHHHNQPQPSGQGAPGSQMQSHSTSSLPSAGQLTSPAPAVSQQPGASSQYPTTSSAQAYPNYGTGYSVEQQQYMMGTTAGYPPTSGAYTMRSPNLPGQQRPPTPASQQPPHMQQPAAGMQQQPAQQQGQHVMQNPPPSAYPGYQSAAGINMPPLSGQPGAEQSGYGNPPPPPMGTGGINQYRMSGPANPYGRPQAQMGYK